MKPIRDYDLVIFDCDGVLVDSEPIAARVCQEILAEEGIGVSLSEIEHHFTGTSENDAARIVRHVWNRDLKVDFGAEMTRRLLLRFSAELRAIEGIVDIVRSLQVPSCVASNSPPERVMASLEIIGLASFFEGRIFTPGEQIAPKPAPDVYVSAARFMGAPPERCFAVEDSVAGVKAAVAAGVSVLGFAAGLNASTGAEALTEAGASIILDGMGDLHMLLTDYRLI